MTLTDVREDELEALLERIKEPLSAADFALVEKLASTVKVLTRLLRDERTTLARLRRLTGLRSTERTDKVLSPGEGAGAAPLPAGQGGPGAQEGPSDASGGEGPGAGGGAAPEAPDAGASNSPSGASLNSGSEEPRATPGAKPPRKGHGRLATGAYEEATHVAVPHPSLHPGQRCPQCECGNLRDTHQPAQLLRIVGQPMLIARCWDCERLRCNSCGKTYTAPAPKEAQGPKFEESAVSVLALCRFGLGLPHWRLAGMQRDLQTPIPASTQWDVLWENRSIFVPVFQEMRRQAAQGDVLHEDDTYARIASLMGNRRAQLVAKGKLPDPQRTGLYTTGIVSLTAEQPIVLFFTGRKYAGENLADLLDERKAHREPPILMKDGLDSRNIPKEHPVKEANCNAHARRGIVDQVDNAPGPCRHVLKLLGTIYKVDKTCKAQGLSPQARLERHQRDSGPAMDKLRTYLTEQLDAKQVEPNCGLGTAFRYILKRWDKLTLFLREPGTPLDNNLCERVLKMAIRHRRNSLFYRSQRGARLGDLFMSLIHTTVLRGGNPLDYLTQVQRHAQLAAANPAQWLPWTYRETLARLQQGHGGSRASPPRPPPCTPAPPKAPSAPPAHATA